MKVEFHVFRSVPLNEINIQQSNEKLRSCSKIFLTLHSSWKEVQGNRKDKVFRFGKPEPKPVGIKARFVISNIDQKEWNSLKQAISRQNMSIREDKVTE